MIVGQSAGLCSTEVSSISGVPTGDSNEIELSPSLRKQINTPLKKKREESGRKGKSGVGGKAGRVLASVPLKAESETTVYR